MKHNFFKIMKSITLSILAVAIVMVGSLQSSVGVKASSVTNVTQADSGVIYVQYNYTNDDYTKYLNDNKAPLYDGVDADGVGYLFGGWYDKQDSVYEAIKDTTDLANVEGVVVAKFVPAQTLSVKCQNWAGTNADSDRVIVRVISAVDTTNYSQYGFVVSRIDKEGNETLLTTEPFISEDVYSRFNYYQSENDTQPQEYRPKQLFGAAAGHFITCTVGYIPKEAHSTIICIKPFWDTLDGTRVYGLSKYAHVEDGYKGYVNVPVNLNILSEDNKAAAGYLTVTCRTEGLTFLGVENGVEYGKVFDEMECNVVDGIIKCVGNTSNVSDIKNNDIYINLKFQRDNFEVNNPTVDTTFYQFDVENEKFCSSGEDVIDSNQSNVWNIKY